MFSNTEWHQVVLLAVLMHSVAGIGDTGNKLTLSRSQWLRDHPQFQPANRQDLTKTSSIPWAYIPEVEERHEVTDGDIPQVSLSSGQMTSQESLSSTEIPEMKGFLASWANKIMSLRPFENYSLFPQPSSEYSYDSDTETYADPDGPNNDSLEYDPELGYSKDQKPSNDSSGAIAAPFEDYNTFGSPANDHVTINIDAQQKQPSHEADDDSAFQEHSSQWGNDILLMDTWTSPSSTIDNLSDDNEVFASPVFRASHLNHESVVDDTESFARNPFLVEREEPSSDIFDSDFKLGSPAYDDDILNGNPFLEEEAVLNLLDKDYQHSANAYDDDTDFDITTFARWLDEILFLNNPDVYGLQSPSDAIDNNRDMIEGSNPTTIVSQLDCATSDQNCHLEELVDNNREIDTFLGNLNKLEPTQTSEFPALVSKAKEDAATEDLPDVIAYPLVEVTPSSDLSRSTANNVGDEGSFPKDNELTTLPNELQESTTSLNVLDERHLADSNQDQTGHSEIRSKAVSIEDSNSQQSQITDAHDSIPSLTDALEVNAINSIAYEEQMTLPVKEPSYELQGQMLISSQTSEIDWSQNEIEETSQFIMDSDENNEKYIESVLPSITPSENQGSYSEHQWDTRKPEEVQAFALPDAKTEHQNVLSSSEDKVEQLMKFISKWRIAICSLLSIICCLIAFALIRYRRYRKRLAVIEQFSSMQIPSKQEIVQDLVYSGKDNCNQIIE